VEFKVQQEKASRYSQNVKGLWALPQARGKMDKKKEAQPGS
jgi:hypothetical protein